MKTPLVVAVVAAATIIMATAMVILYGATSNVETLLPLQPLTLAQSNAMLVNRAYDCVTTPGYPLCLLHEHQHDSVVKQIRESGVFEPHIGDAILQELLRLSDTCADCLFVDVGGNVGVMTLLVLARTPNTQRVVTIEALPLNAALIAQSASRSISFAERLTLYNVAVSNSGTDLLLCAMEPPGNPSDGILVPYAERFTHPYVGDWVRQRGCDHLLRATTIDALALITVAVMKMDIEGFEYLALQGATTLLADDARAPCMIIVEYNPGLSTHNATQLTALMKHYSYAPHELSTGAAYPGGAMPDTPKGYLINVAFRLVGRAPARCPHF